MKHEYRQFQLTLRTLAPVHIGSGEKYTAREYIRENGSFYFPDMTIFYKRLLKAHRASVFEEFLQGSKNTSKRLQDFCQKQNITERGFGGYHIQETGLEREGQSGETNEIVKFMRDSYGCPYIPGSSLKGAIRTILMNTKWKNDNFIAPKGDEKNGNLENKDVIPWKPVKDVPFDSLFNEIRVSDSHPLSNDQLIIVQKWDYSERKQEVTPLPLYRESLAPMTEITFTITTSSGRAGNLIASLESYAQEYYKLYYDFYLRKWPKCYIQDNQDFPIYLGAGSGAWTKTVMEQANEYVQKRNSFGKMKMIDKGAMKLTKAPDHQEISLRNNKHLYEMGKACFIVEEMEI